MIDDNAVTLKRCESLLVPLGHEVLSFTGAEPALQTLMVHPTHLIVLDLQMPIHDGYDLMSTLRSRSIQVPILVVSGKNQQQDITKAMKLGAADYVLKPFDDQIFLSKVKSLLQLEKQNHLPDFFQVQVSAEMTVIEKIPVFRISELGLEFESTVAYPRGRSLQLGADVLRELNLGSAVLKVSTCELLQGPQPTYRIFVSFVGFNAGQLQEVRLWLRAQQLTTRRRVA